MGSGIECRTERIQLGISTKPMEINGDLHETPVQCFFVIRPSVCPALYNLREEFNDDREVGCAKLDVRS